MHEILEFLLALVMMAINLISRNCQQNDRDD